MERRKEEAIREEKRIKKEEIKRKEEEERQRFLQLSDREKVIYPYLPSLFLGLFVWRFSTHSLSFLPVF